MINLCLFLSNVLGKHTVFLMIAVFWCSFIVVVMLFVYFMFNYIASRRLYLLLIASIIHCGNVCMFDSSCTEAFTGTFCQRANPCYPASPCMNGAKCEVVNTPTTVDFKCRCPLGYTGVLCGQKDQNSACFSNPCENGRCGLSWLDCEILNEWCH